MICPLDDVKRRGRLDGIQDRPKQVKIREPVTRALKE